MALWVRDHHRHEATAPLAVLNEVLGVRDARALSDAERAGLTRRFGSRLGETLSLAGETNVELFWEQCLTLGARFEQAGRPDLAARFYRAFQGRESGAPTTAQLERSAQALAALNGGNFSGRGVETLLRGAVREATDPALLAGMTAAGVTFRLMRLASLSRVASLAPNRFAFVAGNALSFGAAYSAEALAFPLVTRGVAGLLGRGESNQTLSASIASSFIMLGALRFSGVATRGLAGSAWKDSPRLAAALGQAGLFGGIVAGQWLEEHAGLHVPAPGENRIASALAMLVQFQIAGRISERLIGTRAWEEGIDRHIDGIRESLRETPHFSTILDPALAIAMNRPLEARRPKQLLPGHSVLMSGDGPISSGPLSRTNLEGWLRRLTRIEDPQAVETALRLLYVGTIAPPALRAKLFDAIVHVKEGNDIANEVRSLMLDGRLKGTRFYSAAIHDLFDRHILEALQPTPGRGNGNGRRLISEIGRALRGAFEPLNQNEDRLRLDMQRFKELRRIGASNERTLSARRALDEIGLLGENFIENILKAIEDANLDFLTGFYNRRGLDRLTPKIEGRLLGLRRFTEANKLPDYVLMLDIDFFKRVNDTHGHEAGDVVLRTVAGVFRDNVRERDFKVRQGGEEFLIVLPKAGREGAEMVAEKLRAAVASASIRIPGKSEPLPITISIGVSELKLVKVRGQGMTVNGALDAAMRNADQALYEAKNTGRNRVVVFREK